VSAAKRACRDARIPPAWRLERDLLPLDVTRIPEECGILTADEVAITRTPAAALVAAMVAGEYTAERVMLAFCKRAAIAQQLTNCLTEVFFAQALADARALDAKYKRTGVPRGRLHGLPVSLKDNMNVPGLDSSNGYVAYCNTPMGEKDMADVARVMRDTGAILYCKTNVPTGMVSPILQITR
jgi:amidase